MKKIFKTLPVFFASILAASTIQAQTTVGTTTDVDYQINRFNKLSILNSQFSTPGGSFNYSSIPFLHISTTALPTFNSGGEAVQVNGGIELGVGTTKAFNAARIRYNSSGTGLLEIFGGGTSNSNLAIKFYNGGGASFTHKVRIGSKAAIGTHADYALSVYGKILATSMFVTVDDASNWADFVFKNDYKLIPLSEVENFIKKEGHLKGIPTTQEVMENGIDVAQMNARLLEKVEELTLYMIEMKKELDTLKNGRSSK